jgi:class 3 adenylate cyclase
VSRSPRLSRRNCNVHERTLRVTEIMIAIGIATGDVAGNVGSGKLEYLIFVDAVNVESRLRGMTNVAHTMLANAETASPRRTPPGSRGVPDV